MVFIFFPWGGKNGWPAYREEGVDEVGLDGGERLALDDHRVALVLLSGHEAAEPGPLGQLWRGLGGLVAGHHVF